MPTSAVWAFYVQVAVPMRLPDAGRLIVSNLPHAGLGTVIVRSRTGGELLRLGRCPRRHLFGGDCD
jgi:hypothetical protein